MKPPTGTFHSETSLSFFKKRLDNNRNNKKKNEMIDQEEELEGEVEYFEHIQTKGEVIYVPELYSHATLNLDDSIGVAMAFS